MTAEWAARGRRSMDVRRSILGGEVSYSLVWFSASQLVVMVWVK
jgi:hypothetical protein